MATAFESFVNTELPLRVLTSSVLTAGRYLRVKTTSTRVLEQRTPAEVLADIGGAAAAANLTNNMVVRGDGGAKGVQTSGIIIDDSNRMGLGQTTPLSELDIKRGSPATPSNADTLLSAVGRITGTDVLRGGRFFVERLASSETSNILVGLHASAHDHGSQNLTNDKWAIVGMRAKAEKSGGNSGTIASMRAFSGESEVLATINGITVTNCCIYVAEPVMVRGNSLAVHACCFWGKAHDVVSGAITHAWGVRLEKQTVGGTSNHGVVLEGDGIGADLALGADQDALIYYDGTDLILDPNVVGSGKVLIGATGNDRLKAAVLEAIGDLKIQPDVQGDVLLFGDTDVDDAAAGKRLRIHRKAAEGDDVVFLYITASRVILLDASNDFFLNSGGYVKLVAADNIYLDLGDNAGVRGLRVRDSDKATVAAIDSNGNMTLDGTVDGRNIATDGTKLDTIETNADVTDAANVAGAGAVMDSDISPGEGFLRKTGAGAYTAHKSNLAASTAPTVNEDSDDGYSVGSEWIDTTGDKIYFCLDATVGAAVWQEVGSGGGGGAVQHIVIDDMTIPDTDGAGIVTIEDSSTPAVKYPAWSFDESTDKHIDLFGHCTDQFDSAKDIEILVTWRGAAATSGNVKWDAAFKRIVDDSTTITSLNVTGHTSGTETDVAPGTLGQVTTATITISSHGMTAGDRFHLRLSRDISVGGNMSGKAYMQWARLREAS